MTKTVEPKDVARTEPPSLPSLHIDHSANFANELDSRLMGFQSALEAVKADMDGMQREYERDCAERAAKHSEAIAARDRLKRDIERAHRMASAARDAYADDIPAAVEESP